MSGKIGDVVEGEEEKHNEEENEGLDKQRDGEEDNEDRKKKRKKKTKIRIDFQRAYVCKTWKCRRGRRRGT